MIQMRLDDGRLQRALSRLAQKAKNTLGLMREIAGIMRDEVEENFDQQGRPRWVDLAESTKKKRAKRGHWPGSILQERGRMAASVSEQASDTRAVVGSNVVYGPAQHFGAEITFYPRSSLFRQNRGTKGRFSRGKAGEIRGGAGKASSKSSWTVRIPARPWLTMASKGVDKIVRAVKRFILGGT